MDNERIFIHELEVENFKSYAKKKILGPFHISFNSIVGPNGCGKSNIIDAILFVFGYRSSKLRSKKLSCLIHNSEMYPNIESCSVSVNFKKLLNNEIDLDFKLTISRIVKKDNSSEYLINGFKSNFTEITKRLKEYNVDLDHHRFLILQGEVESIALMKAKSTNSEDDDGLLEYLEEIIGSNKYIEEINNLIIEIKKYDEEMIEKINRLKLVEGEKNVLEPLKNDAIEYINKENKLNELKYKELKIKLSELNMKDCNIIEENKKYNDEKIMKESQLLELTKSLKKNSEELNNLEVSTKPVIKEIEKLKNSISSLSRKYIKYEKEIENLEENKEKIEIDLEENKNELIKLKEEPQNKNGGSEKLQRGKEIIENEIIQIEKEIENLLPEIQKKTLNLVKERENKEKLLLDKGKILSESELKLNSAKNSLDLLTSKRETLTRELENIKLSLSNINKRISDNKNVLSTTQSKLDKSKVELKNLQDLLNKSKIKQQDIWKELCEKEQILNQINNNDNINKNRSKVINELMKIKNTNKIKGIHGRLGDLAYIDSKYDCAISSSCSFLDHCVVDNMDVAIQCVEYLRKNNIGIASFIALDKMKQYQVNTSFKCPQSCSRLFDLLQIDSSEYTNAFYFAIKDTLVCNNIDTATKIAFSSSSSTTNTRYRVCTIKGEIIEKNGTITCGGDPIKGRIRTNNDRKSISAIMGGIDQYNVNELVEDINKLKESHTEINKEVSKYESDISECTISINEYENILRKLPNEISIDEQNIININNEKIQLEEQYTQSIPDQCILHKNQLDVEERKKEYDNAQSSYNIIQEQVNKISLQINNIKCSILDSYNTDLSSKKRLLDDINNELNKVTASETSSKRKIEKHESSINELIILERNVKEKLEKEKKEYTNISIELEKNKNKLNELERENLESINEIKNLKKSVEENEKEIEVIRNVLLEIKLKLDNSSNKWKQYENKVKQISMKLEELFIRKYNENGEEIILKVENDEDISLMNINDEIKLLQEYLDNNKPDFGSIGTFYEKNKIYLERFKEYENISNNRSCKNDQLKNIKNLHLTTFIDGFTKINSYLKSTYRLITQGGDAELELVDSFDPFIEGVVLSVKPPFKGWRQLSNLSGGEKTLGSLSLVFALHQYRPAPFYIMDEVDAALDFRNVSIVANIIKQKLNAQFIVVSLRDPMFEAAHRLLGVYKINSCTSTAFLPDLC